MKCLKKLLCTVMAVSVIAGAFSVVLASAVEKAQVNSVSIDLNTASYNEQKVKEFVTRLYDICLDRKPDAQGLADWSGQLKNSQATGVSVAYGFIFSAELQGKSLSNEDYIEIMYKAFFGRKSDAAGKADWLAKMNAGMSREDLFIGFANSKEFFKLCSDYGIICGCHVKGKDYRKMAKINLFVERLYEIVLGRECDQGGMLDWSTRLATGKISGVGAAYGFFFSPEYNGQNNTYSKYIEDLYKALMGRPSDQGGKDNWMDKITNGGSKESVFNGFAGSQEFIKICGDYGIERGDLISEANDTTDTLTEEKDIAQINEYILNSNGKKVLSSVDYYKNGEYWKTVAYTGEFVKSDFKPDGGEYVSWEELSDGKSICYYEDGSYDLYDSMMRPLESYYLGGTYYNIYDKNYSYVPAVNENDEVTVYAVNEDGDPTKYRRYQNVDGKTKLIQEGSYKYDSNGNRTDVEWSDYYYTGSTRVLYSQRKEIHTFNSHSDETGAKYYDKDLETGKWVLIDEDKTSYTYNKDGEYTREEIHWISYTDGEIDSESTSVSTFEYDSNGNMTKMDCDSYGNIYEYDADGHQILRKYHDKDEGYWVTYVYEIIYDEGAKG